MENLGRERFRVERRRCDALWGTIRRDIKSATAIGIYCRRLPDYRSKTRRARQPAPAAAATGMKLLESFNVLGPAGSSDRPRSGRPFAPGFSPTIGGRGLPGYPSASPLHALSLADAPRIQAAATGRLEEAVQEMKKALE